MPSAPRTLDRLDGQVALVTGANRGIGAQVARDLAALGATVYAGARDPARVAASPALRPLALDVTSEASALAALSRVRAEAGRLDVLVNNAAVLAEESVDLQEERVEDLQRVLLTNVMGPMLVAKHALPLLLERPGGRVVNVSSGMGSLSDGLEGGQPAYSVSKAAVNGLTVYLHNTFGARGLLANSVCPGWVRTDMGGPSAPRSVEKGAETPVWLSRLAPGGPGGLFWRDRAVIPW